MKLAVVGKGGSGKTTTSAVLARTLARAGLEVVALDCDTNPNLGMSLGIGPTETARLVAMRQALDEGAVDHAPGWDDLIDRFGSPAPDGVQLAVVNRIDNPEPGCPCCGVSPEQLLTSADFGGKVVVADFEAGIGTITRLQGAALDLVVVVVEPTAKSLEVGVRVAALALERQGAEVKIVANKVESESDLTRVEEAFASAGLSVDPLVVPEDPALRAAERQGRSPLDSLPVPPAVEALEGFARTLVSCSPAGDR